MVYEVLALIYFPFFRLDLTESVYRVELFATLARRLNRADVLLKPTNRGYVHTSSELAQFVCYIPFAVLQVSLRILRIEVLYPYHLPLMLFLGKVYARTLG